MNMLRGVGAGLAWAADTALPAANSGLRHAFTVCAALDPLVRDPNHLQTDVFAVE